MGGGFTEDEANKKRLRKENGVICIIILILFLLIENGN